jgi:hypothetical protein
MTQLTQSLSAKNDRFFGYPPVDTVLDALLIGTTTIVLALVVLVLGTQGVVA